MVDVPKAGRRGWSRRWRVRSAGSGWWIEGACGTIDKLANREKVNRGYMSRVLRLTLLAPDIVEAILNGRQEREVTLGRLPLPCPVQ